jgi:hypothetical protein
MYLHIIFIHHYMHIHLVNRPNLEEIAIMSRHITNTFGRSLALASAAALLIHFGSATAAAPQNDFQSQVSAVLAGTAATPPAVRADSARNETTGTKIDAQQFARQLLLGWSATHPARSGSAAQSGETNAADVSGGDSSAQDDVQSSVQRFLRGE